MFPETENDRRIYLMDEIMSIVDMIVDISGSRFFQDESISFEHEYLPGYTGNVENMLKEKRDLIAINRAVLMGKIEPAQSFTSTVSLVTLFLTIVAATIMAILTVKYFTFRIKVIENKAALVASGQFDEYFLKEQESADEISKIFSHLEPIQQ